MTFTLDWNAIRPLNGGREKGFEELCSQLARAEAPPDATSSLAKLTAAVK